MGKVLLAIDNKTPSLNQIKYSIALCKRLKGSFDILQIMKPSKIMPMSDFVKKIGKAGKIFESSMVAATFGEAGEYEIAQEIIEKTKNSLNEFSSELKEADIKPEIFFKEGNMESNLLKFIERHKGIKVAVLDAKKNLSKQVIKTITKKIKIPLVLVN